MFTMKCTFIHSFIHVKLQLCQFIHTHDTKKMNEKTCANNGFIIRLYSIKTVFYIYSNDGLQNRTFSTTYVKNKRPNPCINQK